MVASVNFWWENFNLASYCWQPGYLVILSQPYLELTQIYIMEIFAKIVKGWTLLTIFLKTLNHRCLTGFQTRLLTSCSILFALCIPYRVNAVVTYCNNIYCIVLYIVVTNIIYVYINVFIYIVYMCWYKDV